MKQDLKSKSKTGRAATSAADGKNSPNNKHKFMTEFADNVRSKLIYDEETGLFYGVGLDEIVEYSKNQNSLNMVDFGDEVSSIMQKLSLFNKDELIFAHRYILARSQAASPTLRQKAKLILVDAITQEVLNQKNVNKRGKNERSLVRSLLDQSVWDSLLVFNTKNPQTDIDQTLKRVSELNISEEKIDMIALFLAKQKVKSILKEKATSSSSKVKSYYNPKIPVLFAQDPFFPGKGKSSLSSTLNDLARELESWNVLVVEKAQDLDTVIQEKINEAYFKHKLQLLANNGLPDFDTATELKEQLSQEPQPDILTFRAVVREEDGRLCCDARREVDQDQHRRRTWHGGCCQQEATQEGGRAELLPS